MPWMFPGKTLRDVIQNETKILQGKAGQKVFDLAAEKGFHMVALHGLSPNVVFSTKPIKSLADFKGKKFRVVPGKEHTGTFSDWGALATPMAFSEVYTSLQQGVIQGVEDPPDVSINMNFQEVAPYVAVTKHNAFVEYYLVSKKWYDSLPADLQKVVDEAGQEMIQKGTQAYMKSEGGALDKLRAMDKVTVTDFPQSELDKMKQLNQDGIWKTIEKDPQKGPILKLLQQDIKDQLK